MKKIYLFLTGILISLSISAQDYTQVYLIGGATPYEWDNTQAQTMTLVSSDTESAVFTWTGPLKASDFKFINELGTWNPAFTAENENESVQIGKEHRLLYNDGADHKFILSKADFYTVTIDLKKLTMTVTQAELEPSEELWIKGSAVPNGIAKLSNAYGVADFLYVGELLQGNFKIMTTETVGDFTRYIVPWEEDIDLTGETRFIITDDADIPGWNVTIPDQAYKIKINLISEKSNAEIYIPRENLYMVGGAPACGWNAGQAIPFVKDEQNPDVFIFDGELKIRPENVEPNLFKILGQLDWNPYSLHPHEFNEPILGSKYVRIGGDDTKWEIDESKQGRYVIKVNTLYETIEAQYVEQGSKVIQTNDNGLFQIISQANGIRITTPEDCPMVSAQLYNMKGQLFHSIRNAGKEFVLGNNVTPGIYLLKIDCGKKHVVQRVLIK